MFNLGMGEITVVLLLAMIFLGPKKLPELASGLGRLIRQIRKTTSDVKNEIQLDDAIRKPFEELRDAVTLHPDELKRRDEIKRQIEEVRQRTQELADAEAAAGTSEVPPVNNDDVTVVQDSPLPSEAIGGDIIVDKAGEASAPPAGTVARPDTLPAAPRGTARYGSPAGVPPPHPTVADAVRNLRPVPPPPVGLPAPRRVTPPITRAALSDTTQSLTEADLLPSVAASSSMFPPPPPANTTAKLPGVAPPPPVPGDAPPPDDKKAT